MRHLNLQLQPERAPALDMARVNELVGALAQDRTIVAAFESKAGEDEGPYVNFTFAATDAGALWQKMRDEVLAHDELGAQIASAAIVICEGEQGWDDYLLLHHFDPQYPLDEADEL